MRDRYYLRTGYATTWDEVTHEQFIEAKQAAGKSAEAGDFHGRGMRGEVRRNEQPPTNPRAQTATPWRVCEFPHSASDVPWSIKDADGVVILDCRTEELAEQIVNDHNQHTKLVAALRAFEQGFRDGSIKWAKPRQSDSDPYHPANVLMSAALANEPESEVNHE